MISALNNGNARRQKAIKEEIMKELNLSVAPTCNMMCNFCSKVSNGIVNMKYFPFKQLRGDICEKL